MTVTLTILSETDEEIARITFPNKQALNAVIWYVTRPWKYHIEWESEE